VIEPLLPDEESAPVSHRTLRQFAGLWIVFFIALAVTARGSSLLRAAVFAGLALGVGPLGVVRPETIRPIFLAWMGIASPVGRLVSPVLVAGLFYGLLPPVGALFRLFGRDVLRLQRQQARPTYWSSKPGASDVRRYLRQF